MTPEQIEAYVDASAAALGLEIASAHRPGVLHYFALAASMAALVQSSPPAVTDEPAPVFHPVAAAE